MSLGISWSKIFNNCIKVNVVQNIMFLPSILTDFNTTWNWKICIAHPSAMILWTNLLVLFWQMLLRQHLPWKSRPWLTWSELNWELAKCQVVDALSEAVTDSLQVTPYSDDQRRVQCRRVELPCQASDRDAKKVWETKMSQPIDQEYKATPATSGCGWLEVESDADNKRCLPNCFQ